MCVRWRVCLLPCLHVVLCGSRLMAIPPRLQIKTIPSSITLYHCSTRTDLSSYLVCCACCLSAAAFDACPSKRNLEIEKKYFKSFWYFFFLFFFFFRLYVFSFWWRLWGISFNEKERKKYLSFRFNLWNLITGKERKSSNHFCNSFPWSKKILRKIIRPF